MRAVKEEEFNDLNVGQRRQYTLGTRTVLTKGAYHKHLPDIPLEKC